MPHHYCPVNARHLQRNNRRLNGLQRSMSAHDFNLSVTFSLLPIQGAADVRRTDRLRPTDDVRAATTVGQLCAALPRPAAGAPLLPPRSVPVRGVRAGDRPRIIALHPNMPAEYW